MKGRSLSGYQRKRVWLNDGRGRFTEAAQVVGALYVYETYHAGLGQALADAAAKAERFARERQAVGR